MADTVYACSGGCGHTEVDESKLHERGFVQQRAFCDTCVKQVDKYIEARDKLQETLAEEWQTGLAKLATIFALKGGKLPDAG